MKTFFVWALTLLIIGIAVYATIALPREDFGDYGSVFAAASGFIAVIWFYRGLVLQTEQIKQQQIMLEEQRKQFNLEFNNIRLDSKRNAMLVARNILNDMEPKVVEKLGGEIETFPTIFVQFLQYLKPISESDDPDIVLDACTTMMKIITPAKLFLTAIMEAGICILENEGFEFVNKNKENITPELYIIANFNNLTFRPFLSKYMGTARMLANLMSTIDLDIVKYATLAANELKYKGHLLTDEGIQKIIDYNTSKKKGIPIINRYLATLKAESKQ